MLYLSDSNIDWGQDLEAVKTFMDERRIPISDLSGDPEALGALAETYRRMGLAAIADLPRRIDPT